MAKTDRDNDPILDANDVACWVALGLLASVPVLVWSAFDLPLWTVLLLAVVIGVAMRPIFRRYRRRSEAKRPNRDLPHQPTRQNP